MPSIKSKIIIPTWAPVCQVDGKVITKQTEPNGRLVLVNGHPMCAFHRLTRLHAKGKLDYRKVFAQRAESQNAQSDHVAAEQAKTQKEKQRVAEIAAASQERAAKIDKRTKLTRP